MVVYPKMIYYDGPFLVCSKSGGINGQMDKFTVLIYHALSLKLSLKNIPWALLYPILRHTSFIFKSELNPKLSIQIQTQVYLQALRILCTIAANSFCESYILLLFTCNLKPEHKPRPYIKPNHSYNP